MSGLWDHPGVPKRGWNCKGMSDLGPEKEGDQIECEMCEARTIRYAHRMEHPEYPGALEVGSHCAAKMEADPYAAREREREFRNRLKRLARWMALEWHVNAKGNFVLRDRGLTFTIIATPLNKWKGVVSGHWRGPLPLDKLKEELFELAELAREGDLPPVR